MATTPPRTAVTAGEIRGLFPPLRQRELTPARFKQIVDGIVAMINSSGGVVPSAAAVVGLFTPEEQAAFNPNWFVLLNMSLQRELGFKGLRTATLGPPSAPRFTPNEVYEREAVIARFKLRKRR